jgi:hypothetical protein
VILLDLFEEGPEEIWARDFHMTIDAFAQTILETM